MAPKKKPTASNSTKPSVKPRKPRSKKTIKTLQVPTINPPSQPSSQQTLPQSIFGRSNRLDDIFSSQTAADASDSGADLDSSLKSKKRGGEPSKTFEEDEGFFYKRTKPTTSTKKRSKQKPISTPIFKLNQALDELPNNNLHDSFDSMDFEPEVPPPKKTKIASIKKTSNVAKLSSPIRPRYEGTYKEPSPSSADDDEYVEQVSHHTINLTGGDDSDEDIEPTKSRKKHNKDRRSSYSNRGKRMSSIGNGLVASPHEDVLAKDYYKHIDTSLSEPHRMKQLLIWCIKKKIKEEDKKHQQSLLSSDDQVAINIAKVIKDETLHDLKDGTISTSWYNIPELSNDSGDNGMIANQEIVLPNPLNLTTEQNIKKFTKQLNRLKREKEQWKDMEKRNVSTLDKNLTSIDITDEKDINALRKHCKDKEVDYNDSVLGQQMVDHVASVYKDVTNKFSDNVENSIDELFNLTNTLTKVSHFVEKCTQSKLVPKISETTKSFVDKSKIQNIKATDSLWPTSSKPLGVKQILQGIAKLDSEKEAEMHV
ncbi:hypothetical protein PSN45_003911 [Yamadazyma tenuis]|uniref:Mis12-Mtw1 protein n=2 Tax=Candida tenuis (strain ATCC 10573 / BCRC 21748 / CBS 615 / JCM 9827 / NBRC 10315 / NRRL Y-1498 / VKM Y-70) TaxID=590646 RepID=G3B4X3_CANTC|nr:uncharacterized protein CANTEDRAFT_134584 [Yamadazyma tenuis ATCC 10573]EGV64012.1 hypothetical protein CANTEDRAFT_134584 [Yamadazyma tenuis ATCC 10573]WEJ96372.1 hypothetical protein PSN45_003911 [Yamadazyma tenuis]